MAHDKWQKPSWASKWVAGALATVALGVAAVYVLKLPRRENFTPVSENLPRDINQQVSGYTVTRSEGNRRIFTVHAARTVAFKNGGKTVLEDVSVEVYGRTATRHDLLKASHCDYQPDAGGLSCLGKVEIELNANAGSAATALKTRQPVYLETSKVDYDPRASVVVSDQPVRFRYGSAFGSAVGIRYRPKDGRVELTKDVAISMSLFASTLPLRITSAGLGYEKETGHVDLRGPLEIIQGRRRVVAGQGRILLDEANRIAQATLTGGVQGSDSSIGVLGIQAEAVKADFDPGSSQLRAMVADNDVRAESRTGGDGVSGGTASVRRLIAQHLKVNFTSPSRGSAQPRNAIAWGNVKLSLLRAASRSTSAPPSVSATLTARRVGIPPVLPQSREPVPTDVADGHPTGRSAGERDELAASQIEAEFQPGAQNLSEARTLGPGELVICPSDPKEGRRLITAGQFLMTFGDRDHLERLRGLSHAKVVVEPPADKPSAAPQESWSDELDAKFDTKTQGLVTLQEAGNVQFRDGERQAKADRAYYSGQDQVLQLVGNPLLWDPDTRIRASQFRIDLRSGRAEGAHGVESTHFEQAKTTLAAAAQATAGTNGHQGETTTNVLADRVVAERASQVLHYEGHVRAWNGYDVIESPSLDIYRKQQRIVSGSGVVSSHLEPARARFGSKAKTSGAMGTQLSGPAPVTVRADQLEYLNEGRQARYRGHVEIESGDMTLKGDRVDVYFSSSPAGAGRMSGPAQIDRVLATGHVAVTQPARHATGERVEYLAGPGKVVMTGGPPVLYDEQNGFTTGQSLTFFIRDDSLLVDGGDKSSTLSKRHLVR